MKTIDEKTGSAGDQPYDNSSGRIKSMDGRRDFRIPDSQARTTVAGYDNLSICAPLSPSAHVRHSQHHRVMMLIPLPRGFWSLTAEVLFAKRLPPTTITKQQFVLGMYTRAIQCRVFLLRTNFRRRPCRFISSDLPICFSGPADLFRAQADVSISQGRRDVFQILTPKKQHGVCLLLHTCGRCLNRTAAVVRGFRRKLRGRCGHVATSTFRQDNPNPTRA